MLDAEDVLSYLISVGLVQPAALLDGEFSITDGSRRHCNFTVLSSAGPSFFVKQGDGPAEKGSVAYEARVYDLLDKVAGTGAAGRLLVRRRIFDRDRGILVLDFERTAVTLRRHYARSGRFATAPAALAGAALATIHGVALADMRGSCSSFLSSDCPPARVTCFPPARLLHQFSAASLALMQQVQRIPNLWSLLDGVTAGWRAEALVHGDPRWDNWLLVPSPDAGRKPSLRLIDWEYAGLGDPAWDVGAFFADYVSHWIFSIPASATGGTLELAAQATSPIEQMGPPLRAFWGSYRRRARLSSGEAGERLLRATRAAAVQLLQTGVEHLQTRSELSRAAVYLAQVCANVLAQPREAASHLLGISPDD